MHVNYQQWACFSKLHTVLHISAHLEKHCNGLLEYRSNVGAMVAVWRCGHLKSMYTCELVSHNAVWMQSMRIGFALNSQWAIRLLNKFESGFGVDSPLAGQLHVPSVKFFKAFKFLTCTYVHVHVQCMDLSSSALHWRSLLSCSTSCCTLFSSFLTFLITSSWAALSLSHTRSFSSSWYTHCLHWPLICRSLANHDCSASSRSLQTDCSCAARFWEHLHKPTHNV